MTDHPITPPPELVKQWRDQWLDRAAPDVDTPTWIATQAARWGSDQELEACCEWVGDGCEVLARDLRAARRPKPPSLKELAKQAWLRFMDPYGHDSAEQEADDYDTIRRALKSLPD